LTTTSSTDFDVLVELLLEAGLDSSLVGGACVLQPERHRCVAVGAEWGDERGLLLGFFLDGDLVVPRVAVEEAEEVAAYRGVDNLINPRQRERVLAAVLVKVGVVDAHPPLVRVLLADEDGIGEPFRMEDFPDEAGRELFGEFFLDGIPSIVSKMAEVLSLGGSFRVDVE
jgi:hypothetical protein